MKWKLAAAGVVGAGLVVGAGIMIGRSTAPTTTGEQLLIIPRAVERRDLSDVLTVNGEVRREETVRINSPVDGKVSTVEVADGDTVNAGDTLFALDGRAAVAVLGDFAFFRSLDVGSDGPDVLQLETILVSEGYPVPQVDSLFTEETRDALAAWQIVRGYGGARPEPDETVTVSLSSNSAGYDVGKANTVAFTIVPSVALFTPQPTGPGASRGAFKGGAAAGKPTMNLSADLRSAVEGSTFTVTVTSEIAVTSDVVIDLTIGGDATAGEDPDDGADFSDIDATLTMPAGQTSATITVTVFHDQVIEDAEDITVSLSDQFGNDPNYIVGPTSEVQIDIPANGAELVPVLTIEADNDAVDEGQSVTLTVTSTVELNKDLDVFIEFGGSARSDQDYVEIDPETLTLPAGNTSFDITLDARRDDDVEGDEIVTAQLGGDPNADPNLPVPYLIGEPSQAVVKISSSDLPELVVKGGGEIAEGEAASFRIVANAAVTEDTSINFQVGGSAEAGDDYEVLTGTAVMRAGSSSVTIEIATIDDDVIFQPSDMLVADWPARVGVVEVDEGEFVLQGAELLSLTEPTFTISMSVSPSDRSELELGQKVDVELTAGGQILPGVISELDDNATVGDGGDESYEGVVQVDGDIAAIDGAAVTIDVTLDERIDVLAVPVAAILRSGGVQEVRVVDDAGKLSRVTVTVGLIDDEWAEITTGLTGDELIVVSVDAKADAAPTGGGDGDGPPSEAAG